MNSSRKISYWRDGSPLIWLTGGALALSLIMVFGLIILVLINGLGFFWPADIHRFQLKDGNVVQGQIMSREKMVVYDLPAGEEQPYQLLIKQGNRDQFGMDFLWVEEKQITNQTQPKELVLIERTEWGNFYGTVQSFEEADGRRANDSQSGVEAFENRFPQIEETRERIAIIEKGEIGKISKEQERLRLALRRLEVEGRKTDAQYSLLQKENESLHSQYLVKERELETLRASMGGNLYVANGAGKEKRIPIAAVVRLIQPNSMNALEKLGVYLSKLGEFLWEEPRESNTEGGVFPAIFGTVMMVMIMSILVTPLGVIAAFYLREYAKQGRFVSIVRIAVNNLAGVPSIVFGVFGVGFFIYFVGGSIDRLFFSDSLPTPTFGTGGILWASLTLALLTVPVVIVATEEGLAAIPRGLREASLALGATKFETTWRVVLPAVMPSVLTGLILAMARAAGEVAPLMITGVVKLAPSLPIDGNFPFVHLDQKFMHLGFHIYDVGFQSPNVDAARPMVFMTTVLLLAVVLFLNLGAIRLRNRLRKKFAVSAV